VIINTLLIFLYTYFIIVCLYLMLLTVSAYNFKKRINQSAAPLRLAIVIPAYNEEFQIESTINAIRKSSYPKNLYSIFVIADNCTDQTSVLSKLAGAQVFEHSNPFNRGKGQALDWFFKNHKDAYANFEGVVIIDADTVLDNNFLKEISSSLSHPDVKVVQGFNGVFNMENNWRTALLSAAFNVFNHLLPAGHNRIGGTAGLRGNGMAFRVEILKKYGWPSYSAVEDAEFSLNLLLDKVLVHYNPDAIVRSEMPVTGKQAETQRMRWEADKYKISKKYFPLMVRALSTTHRICYFDAIMSLITPPLALLIIGLVFLSMVTLFINSKILPLTGFCFILITIYVFSGQIMKKASFKVWCSLLTAPLYILWKIPVYIKLIKNRSDKKWIRTQRISEMKKKF